MSTLYYTANDGVPTQLVADGHPLPPLKPGEVALEVGDRVTPKNLDQVRLVEGELMLQDRWDLLPPGAEPADVDVLMICGFGQPGQWLRQTAFQQMTLLHAHGITMAGTVIPDRNALRLMQVIEEFSPKVVIVRGLLFDAALMEALAQAFPGVQWCAINHSSQDFLLCSPRGHCTQQELLSVAGTRQNVWYATPNRTPLRDLAETDKWLYLPNVYPELPAYRERQLHEPLQVSLVSALRALKCWPSQIIAAGLAHREHPLELQLCFERPEEDHYWLQMQSLLDVARVPYRVHPWRDMEQFVGVARP